MRSFGLRFPALVGAGALIVGCSDARSATGPTVAADPAASRQLLLTPTRVSVVTRDVPLSTPETASALIRWPGGRITLANAGLTIVIPPFAVSTPTLISVTAVAGAQVAYEFEPHGTQFNVPLIAMQSLSGTSASNNALLPSVLYAGYFQSAMDLDPSSGTALVAELLGTSIRAGRTVTFAIPHFSGYLIATGQSPPEGEWSQE